MTERLAASYDRCRALHRAQGRSYYLATRLLPRWKRRHVHALYGFARYTDEIVDRFGDESPEDRATHLHRWAGTFVAGLDGAPVDDPVLPAVLHTIDTFDLDRADFASFLRSMEMDLTVTEYQTYDDLLGYMEGSAAAIGTMMLPILGASDLAAAREPARQLGLAFQLTNFIRDVGEDLARGRIYLPLKDLARFGVAPYDLRERVATGPVRELIAFEVGRAREHYDRAAPGIPLLEPRSQRCISAAFRLYGGILDEVERAGYDVFERRATVPNRRRLAAVTASVLTRPQWPSQPPGPVAQPAGNAATRHADTAGRLRTVRGRTDSVVVVGAGLGGLACALHLAGAGREVTVVERAAVPGGRAGRVTLGGYEFDTGPAVLTMPDLIEEALAPVGERLSDWLDLDPLEPAYRAHFADGSTLDVIADTGRMHAEIARVCGAAEADGYLRFVDYARRLWRLERRDFIERNLDSPRDLLTGNLLRLIAAGGFRHLQAKIDHFFTDPRTRRAFSFEALYAGIAPHDALALYAVITYMDAVAGVYFPRGGVHALPRALAGAAAKHGVQFRYDTTVARVDVRGGRATGVRTTTGELLEADVVVLNPDLPIAYRDLLPGTPRRIVRLRPSPSAVVLHVGSLRRYDHIAHHNLHFGRAWRRTFDEVIRDGRLMSDPSLMVSNPTRSDPSLAPAGREVYYVLAPVPNLAVGGQDWRDPSARRYADQLVATLEARGYAGFGDGIEVSHTVTPADWAEAGMAAGTPFAAAHTLSQTGPFRPDNLHHGLENVVFVGSGTQPGVGVPMVLISGKLGAQRIVGAPR